jgi:hypothetical protein
MLIASIASPPFAWELLAAIVGLLRASHKRAPARRAARPGAVAAIASRHGLELDFASIPGLLAEHGLRFGPAEA